MYCFLSKKGTEEVDHFLAAVMKWSLFRKLNGEEERVGYQMPNSTLLNFIDFLELIFLHSLSLVNFRRL